VPALAEAMPAAPANGHARLPARPGPYPMAVLLVNGRAGAVSGLPSPEPALSTAPVPVLPSAHGASRA